MKILLALVLAHQGQVIVLQPGPQVCAGPITVFAQQFHCRPDGALIVGVDTAQPAGIYPVAGAAGTIIQELQVTATAWKRRELPQAKHAFPPTEDERALKDAVYETHLQERWTHLHLQLPLWSVVDGHPRVSDPFGVRRSFLLVTGEPFTEVHRGVDLAVPTGTPVQSMTSGVVVLARFLPLEGNTVIIYHGDAVYTAYCHLSHLSVREGDRVSGGHRVGLSGATPAGQGLLPHLHWAMRIGTAYVDPRDAVASLGHSLYLQKP